MLNKKKIDFESKQSFIGMKLSADPGNTSYTVGLTTEVYLGEPDILWQTVCYIRDTKEIWTGGTIYSGAVQSVLIAAGLGTSSLYNTLITGSSNTKGSYSVNLGYETKTTSLYETALGKLNLSHNNTLFSVGAGYYLLPTGNVYKNAVEVMFNGDTYITGVGNFNGSNNFTGSTRNPEVKTLLEVLSSIQDYPYTVSLALTDLNDRLEIIENLDLQSIGGYTVGENMFESVIDVIIRL